MKIRAKTFPFTLAIAAQTSTRSFRRFTHSRMRPVTLSLPRPSEASVFQQTNFAAAGSRTPEPLSIYAVDDATRLTELYTTLLEAAGYAVRTFNHRAKALAALRADRRKPALLITNYLGLSMPVDRKYGISDADFDRFSVEIRRLAPEQR